jgi:hypothetical protein
VGSGSTSSEGSSSDDNDDEEGEDAESASGDEIAQLAQQLGAPEPPIPISEQLQVMIAFICPEVVP